MVYMSKNPVYQKTYKKTEKGVITQSKYYASIAKKNANTRYRKKYPQKLKAIAKLNYHIRKGYIKRGTCEVCKTKENVQAHHEDYSKPLDVIWVCPLHHRAIHLHKESVML